MIATYQHGIYPRSEALVAATRDLERGRCTPDTALQVAMDDADDFVAAQQEAGFDYFSDGLLAWQDVFRPFVDASPGLVAGGLVRWFDNNAFFRAPQVTAPPACDVPGVFTHDGRAPRPRVATLPSPYMFSRATDTRGSRRGLMLELAQSVLRPTAEELARRGYELVHLEEPWLVYFGIDDDEWPMFEKVLATISDGLGAKVVLHTYFGDAGPYVDRLRAMPVHAVGVDLVETDVEALGSGWDVGLAAGCIDGRSSLLEDADSAVALARRVRDATDAPVFYVTSNSALELLPRDVARRKVLRLGEIGRKLKESAP
ncbi:MAG TPA: hypothetical protein VHJ34_02705 [Actinomycetota bacterium]|nr:hypothetical protein [Actinomycetota bacterium]